MDLLTNDFIKKQCKEDSLFCGGIRLKERKHFKAESNYELFSYAYIFDDAIDMEKESANFFIFGIRENGKTIFYDFAADLYGEIQLELNGFEIKQNTFNIWGKSFPAIGNSWGKMKISIENMNVSYDFTCHRDHY